MKYNTDKASREYLRISSYAFCLRDEFGNLIYTKREVLEDTTNLHPEPEAIL